MLYWCSPSACNKLFKKELIKDLKFIENLMWEDVGFTFSAMILSNRIANVNSLNYFYRRDIKSGETAKGYKLNPNLFDIFKEKSLFFVVFLIFSLHKLSLFGKEYVMGGIK